MTRARILGVLATGAAVVLTAAARQTTRYDLVIADGQVIDGSGAPRRRADVGIRDGQIARVGRIPRSAADTVIDASRLVVAPGFIDVHTHADDVAERPFAENFIRMGVTTIVAGNCGGSALDIGEALERIRQVGTSPNFATLVGHNTVRRAVMGAERRQPTPQELAKMRSYVWKAMADGAVGLSTGLQYVPGTYAESAEIIELARVAAASGGIYTSHMRNEGTELEQAIAETIRVGEASGARVQISHLKVDSPNRWGASARALALVDAARTRGVDVRADQYAYTAASSGLAIRFPPWALEGGPEHTRQRLQDPATWERIRTDMRALLAERGLSDLSFATVASYAADPSLNGLTMKEVASKLKGSDAADAQFEAAREMLLRGGASMVYHFMSDEDVARIMAHPQVAFASDSGVLAPGEGVPHPRGYGNNARVLGEYVRRRHVIALEEAIRKMTSLPAQHFRFERRGLVREGYAADLVVFDPNTIEDRATFDRPHAYAAGVPFVLVNGELVVRDGEITRAKPGKVLTSPSTFSPRRLARSSASRSSRRYPAS
ncbi:MAG TPA: D-aminoacylase [Vicinamibacterales bacterium]|nr:D-aminoacylase [Vicinamibacterales bacterium]